MNSNQFESQAEKLQESPDWFIENPPRQPKAEIASYIEAETIPNLLFPKRYSISEGVRLTSEKPIIFRTEDPREYAGASGAGESVVFGPEDKLLNEDDLLDRLNIVNNNVKVYNQQSSEEIMEFSYSAWEVISGTNKTIYKDDTIPSKFHIFSRWKDSETGQSYASYMQIMDKELVFSSGDTPRDSLAENNILLTETYENICALDKFSSTHSSVMEFQEPDSEPELGQHYFLQTHRGREQKRVNFELGEAPEGYIEIQDVRGATATEEGITVEILLDSIITKYPDGTRPRDSYYAVDYLQRNEDPRQAQVVITKASLKQLASNHKYSHFNVDILTKPQIVIFPEARLTFKEDLIAFNTENTIYNYQKKYIEEGRGNIRLIDFSTTIHVISDGQKAHLSKPQTLLVRFWDQRNKKLVELEINPNGSYIEVN